MKIPRTFGIVFLLISFEQAVLSLAWIIPTLWLSVNHSAGMRVGHTTLMVLVSIFIFGVSLVWFFAWDQGAYGSKMIAIGLVWTGLVTGVLTVICVPLLFVYVLVGEGYVGDECGMKCSENSQMPASFLLMDNGCYSTQSASCLVELEEAKETGYALPCSSEPCVQPAACVRQFEPDQKGLCTAEEAKGWPFCKDTEKDYMFQERRRDEVCPLIQAAGIEFGVMICTLWIQFGAGLVALISACLPQYFGLQEDPKDSLPHADPRGSDDVSYAPEQVY